MTFFGKSVRFVSGLFLMLLYWRRLDLCRLTRGKRLAVVGAANSAFNTGLGEFIDNFDVVVRINKAPYVVADGKWRKDIGARTDILFHSFFENEVSGGGRLDFAIYDELGIKYVVNPIANFSGYRVIFNFYKKYLNGERTYSLGRKEYDELALRLNGFQPTIGFCALYALLKTEFSELYITGFTFFKTAFGEGYRNQMKEPEQVQKFIKDAGLHDPDLEFSVFLEMLEEYKDKKIVLDDELKKIVASNTGLR